METKKNTKKNQLNSLKKVLTCFVFLFEKLCLLKYLNDKKKKKKSVNTTFNLLLVNLVVCILVHFFVSSKLKKPI